MMDLSLSLSLFLVEDKFTRRVRYHHIFKMRKVIVFTSNFNFAAEAAFLSAFHICTCPSRTGCCVAFRSARDMHMHARRLMGRIEFSQLPNC